jgi:outer membrane lipoprotein-sorting protein
MKTKFKRLFFMLFLIFLSTVVFSQENDFISNLKTKLLLYRTQKVDQSIVIQTDKTLYRPGETIWMKGYVTDVMTHLLSLNSLELFVQLTDNKGLNIAEGKFILKNGVVDCSFSIPTDQQSDVYHLIAYTPEMENAGIEAVFKKEIFIARPEFLAMFPRLEFAKPFFAPEQKETANIILKDINGKPISGKKFEYQIIKEDRELLSGKGKTGANGTGDFVFLTPSIETKSPLLVSMDIPAGNDRLNLVGKIPLESERINIKFFPDGGKRVPGIPQMVVFEALDQLGLPVNLKANVLDEQGKTLAVTATIQPGLGVFSLLNADDKNLTFKITSEIGSNQVTLLPLLTPGSMSITIKKGDGKSLSLLLGRSPKSELAKFMIVAIGNGEMIWASDFELEQAGVLNVPLENFHSEIASIAVFNETGALVAQKLVYTGKSHSLNVTFTPDKSSYKTGEDGKIKVKIIDQDSKPVKAEFAVSLSDQFAFPSSTLKVTSLNYGLEKQMPFNDALNKINRVVIDYFLATNNLKGFDWNQVTAIDPTKSQNISSGAMRVSGKVVDSKEVPVPNALVSLTSLSLQQFNGRSDERGEFVINLPVSVEKKNLSASATDGSGKGNYHVVLNKTFKDELANCLNNVSVNDWQILEQLYASNYFKDNPDYFKAIPVSKVKSTDKKTREPYWKKYLTTSSNLLEILKTIKPYELMGGKIVFRGANSFNYQDGALIILDGQKMGSDASTLSSINTHDVDDIEVYTNPSDMSRYTSLNSVGVIVITTKRGKPNNETVELDNGPTVSLPKQFKPQVIGNEKYDLKTTLQWIPVLFTDDNGEAVIPFKAGGIKSTFVLELAGFTDLGQWIGNQSAIKIE